MKKSIFLSTLASLIAIAGFSQTAMVELDESLTGKKHVLRTISVKDGKVKEKEFIDKGEAKIAMVKAIETMNMVQLTVSEFNTTEYDVKDDVYIRYSFVLTLDMSMGPPMPGGMPGGMPGQEDMPGGMPDGIQGGGPGGSPQDAPRR